MADTRPDPSVLQPSSTNGLVVPPSPGSAPSTPGVPRATEFPQVIPDLASHTGRNLILCFDGTGDQFDQDNSNIVRFVQLLKKNDRTKQMVYYQAGIGTGVDTGAMNAFFAKVSQIIDTAIATGLGDHVRGGYEFLMQNYVEGDKISLFGFSRGAYTARALAGMLHKVGLLPAYNHEQVPFAYAMFKRDDPEGWKMSNGFKRAFSVDVKIDFLGVFDTVNSVGLIPRELPFAKSNYMIRVFRHALALDEHRAKFKANQWGRTTEKDEKLSEGGKHKKYHRAQASGSNRIWSYVTGGGAAATDAARGRTKPDAAKGDNSGVHKSARETSNHGGHDFSSEAERGHQTDVKEVWFAGAHCDVGGGSVPNETKNSLARIPLRWMIRECFLNNTGILFHSAELDELGISPASLWPVVKIPTPPGVDTPAPAKLIDIDEHDSGHVPVPSGSSLVNGAHTAEATDATAVNTASLVPATPVKLAEHEDAVDALCPIYDQLAIAWWWWILELLPMRQRYQRHDQTLKSWLEINLGGPRVIHGQKRFPTYVHRSVQLRMQKTGYKPRAELLEDPSPVWVD